MSEPIPILLVRQKHDAKRAGPHWDLRVVIGDKAHSWATKKEMPVPGKPILLFAQPTHDRAYALSERIEIPDGQYGAGVTTLDFAQKGTATIQADDAYHIDLNNGDRYLIKKLGPGKYGDKSWLFLKKKEGVTKAAEYQEYKSFAVSNGNTYDVNDLLAHTKDQKHFQSRISDLDWVLAHATPTKKRLEAADITKPVIVTKENGKWVVLDGLHRLAKAKSLGKYSIPSKVISPKDLESLRMSNPYLEKAAGAFDDLVSHKATIESEARQMYHDKWEGDAPRAIWEKAHQQAASDAVVDDDGTIVHVPNVNPYVVRLMRKRHISAALAESYGQEVVDHAYSLANNSSGLKWFGTQLAHAAVGAVAGGALGAKLGGSGAARFGALAGLSGGLLTGAFHGIHVSDKAEAEGKVRADEYLSNKYNPYADKAKNFI